MAELMDFLEHLRWNVWWEMRDSFSPGTSAETIEHAVTHKINSMTNMQLAEAINQALEDKEKNV